LEENENDKKFCNTITTAAVCVYPSRVADAVNHLSSLDVKLPVASGNPIT
jgi:deoxyribose-phosphate aldolase